MVAVAFLVAVAAFVVVVSHCGWRGCPPFGTTQSKWGFPSLVEALGSGGNFRRKKCIQSCQSFWVSIVASAKASSATFSRTGFWMCLVGFPNSQPKANQSTFFPLLVSLISSRCSQGSKGLPCISRSLREK